MKMENNLEITKQRLKDWGACCEGFKWFVARFPQGAAFGEVYNALREAKKYSDGDWLVEHVFAELGTAERVRETVALAGADKDKIAAQVKHNAGAGDVAATTGNWANAATTGEGANAATTGEGANAATTGNWANAATTGYRANAATTGEGANAATTGYRANAATTGEGANAATTGEGSISATLGQGGQAKAGKDGAVIVAWFDEKAKRPRVAVGYVGENGIEADTWYCAAASGQLAPVQVRAK